MNRLMPMLGSLMLYGLSLALPTFGFLYLNTNTVNIWHGIEVLVMGSLAIFYKQIGWYANMTYFVAVGLLWFRKWRSAAIVGLIGLLIALNTLLMFGQEFPHNGAGHLMRLQSLEAGFYCWIVGLSIPVLWSGWTLLQGPKQSERRS